MRAGALVRACALACGVRVGAPSYERRALDVTSTPNALVEVLANVGADGEGVRLQRTNLTVGVLEAVGGVREVGDSGEAVDGRRDREEAEEHCALHCIAKRGT